MTMTQSAAILAGRALLAYIFIAAGLSKLGDVPGVMAYTASAGIPGVLAIPAIALEILGGVAILVGWRTVWAALALALFVVVAGYLYHYLPAQGMEGFARMAEMNQFLKNVTIAGGFLVLAGFGPGPWSVDARFPARLAAAA